MEKKKPGRPRKALTAVNTLPDLNMDEMSSMEEQSPEPVKTPLQETGQYRFLVNDAQQAYNVQKLRKRCREWDWRGQLKSGHTYEIPHCVAKWINTLGYPTYKQVTNPDGTKETVEAGWIQRFSCIPA